MVDRVIVVHCDRGAVADGIRDYSQMLTEALGRRPVEVELRIQRAGLRGLRGWLRTVRALRRSGPTTAIVLQYNPFCFARWGFAPWLPIWILALRLSRHRPRIAVMVHEPYVPMESWRWVLMGAWQHLQLAAVRIGADSVFASIDPWVRRLEAEPPMSPVRHLPVGSNFPDARSARVEERRRLGAGDETLVVTSFGGNHPGWLAEYVVDAINAIADSGRPMIFLSIGAGAPDLPGLDPSVPVQSPGYLEPAEVAEKLAASDIFLAPLLDGVSTRRGTLMAALQHALPVVGTHGHLTDPSLRESASAMQLTEVGSSARFAGSAVRLAEEPEARAAIGSAGRMLYESTFDWPVIAEKLLAGISDN